MAYHAARFPGDDYSVGQYHSIDDYWGWFAEAGLSILAIDHVTPTALTDFDTDLEAAEAEVAKAIADKSLDPSVRRALQEGIADYRDRARAALDRDSVEAERRVTAQFWEIAASRGPLRPKARWLPRPGQWGAALTALRLGFRRTALRAPGGLFAARASRTIRERSR